LFERRPLQRSDWCVARRVPEDLTGLRFLGTAPLLVYQGSRAMALTASPSPEDKAVAAGNARTGGEWQKLRQAIKDLNGAMRKQRDWLP